MSRYDRDVLADPGQHRRPIPRVEVAPGMIIEVAADGFTGAAVRCTGDAVTLRDRRGRERRFGLHPGAFLVDDVRVTLIPPPRPVAPVVPAVTNSGSLAVPREPAKVARAGRILVEGIHDAALVEQVWGDDLRVEGVVVEVLHGIDDLRGVIDAFGPSADRRVGVLVDHLVPGSKEARVAAEVEGPDVLVTGHPFVDVWAAVRPEVVGIAAWPDVPRGEDW
ncbi:MAG: DUF3097 family protein, partial [Nitriliruptor sp.]